jgi:2-oxoglutarate/2-oxoacid ferredoxin oxidoreductase subunit alpha
MSGQSLTITIGGEAGLGLVTIGDLLTRCLTRSGYRPLVTQDYMSRIRGGHNTFSIRVGTQEVLGPCESVDILVALDESTVDRHRQEVTEHGVIIADEKLKLSGERLLSVPYKDMAEGRYFNTAALGVTAALLGLDENVIADGLTKAFGKKHPEAVEKNIAAVAKAYEWCRDKKFDQLKLPKVDHAEARLTMNGNEAIALGAMAAGVKFCAFYPMTPSTSIALNLAARAKNFGMVVEQAEDEIAAVNMVIGASYAGAPGMVTTSGGGFALMTEGVSLAAMTETPIVIAVVQRPGPATGLPTRTEQGDLEFVLHSGHGEFPRAVFAPGTVEECFHLTRRAFDLAEQSQGPIFILSDQYLADSYRAIEPFDLADGPVVRPQTRHDEWIARGIQEPYRRYALTEDGVSPRLLPGRSEHLVVADSDEHTEDGHITEDLDVRIKINDKRLKKLEGLAKEVVPPIYDGEQNPDLLLVSWGSSRGPVLEAAMNIRNTGRKVGVLHFSQVWPLVPEHFVGSLESAGRVVSVEGNATGQMARLIRRETGFHIRECLTRYDGLPLSAEYIQRHLAE